jgi:hypothetical protein
VNTIKVVFDRTCYKRRNASAAGKTTVYDLFKKYGLDNCEINLVQLFACSSKEELKEKEGEYIENNHYINKIMVGTTKKQD